MDELNHIIAHNISALRSANGMTQLELAEKLNYSDKLISKWERGDSAPNAHTLKQLSEIFGVTIDYLFRDHSEEGDGEAGVAASLHRPDAERTHRSNHRIITAISILSIWMLTLIVFIVLWIVLRPIWMVFIYAIPVSVITHLVLNSIWNNGKHNFFIISALLASICAVLYLSMLSRNLWQIFLLLIPAELLVLLSTRLKRQRQQAKNNGREALYCDEKRSRFSKTQE